MKIGLLLPNSKYYPYIGSDLFYALKRILGDNYTYHIKDTGFATAQDNQKAIKELVLFDNVDFLVGFMDYRSITAVKPLVEQTQTPLVMCNAGVHPLISVDKSPYIIHLSLGVFNSIFLATKWALRNLGNKYSYMSSFFEAGYPLMYAVDKARLNYKGELNNVGVTHKDPNATEVESFINLTLAENDFICLGYHGFEAKEILQYIEYDKKLSGLPLVTSSFVYEPELLSPNLKNQIVTVKSWSIEGNELSEEVNSYFQNDLKRQASVFAMLGFEAAKIIEKCIGDGWTSKEPIYTYLKSYTIKSPRGNIDFNADWNCFDMPYYLIRRHNNVGDIQETCERYNLEQVDIDVISLIEKEMFGWTNSYLCN